MCGLLLPHSISRPIVVGAQLGEWRWAELLAASRAHRTQDGVGFEAASYHPLACPKLLDPIP
eukprot:scaffold20462_cov28-Tisochrysis_lutea.AAC.3